MTGRTFAASKTAKGKRKKKKKNNGTSGTSVDTGLV